MADHDTEALAKELEYFMELKKVMNEKRLEEDIQKALDRGVSVGAILDVVHKVIVEKVMKE